MSRLKVLTDDMKKFLTPKDNEEVLDQPIYHIQTYGTGGATNFSFFQTAVGSATNGLSDTNMDGQGMLSAGKKFAISGISVAFFPSAPMVFNAASTASALNDVRSVMEGTANFQLKILDKTYYTIAPLTFLPAGFGLNVAGSYQRTQASAADGNGFIAHANNGAPFAMAARTLAVPIPVPQQVRFQADINYNSAVTITTAGRIGVYLHGILIRAKQ